MVYKWWWLVYQLTVGLPINDGLQIMIGLPVNDGLPIMLIWDEENIFRMCAHAVFRMALNHYWVRTSMFQTVICMKFNFHVVIMQSDLLNSVFSEVVDSRSYFKWLIQNRPDNNFLFASDWNNWAFGLT